MLTPNRLRLEVEMLSRSNFPSSAYRFGGLGTDRPFVVMAARTNRGTVYTLYFDLASFPESKPRVFVTKMLQTYWGEDLDSASASMHTLNSVNGWTQICHHGPWRPSIPILKVYVKCRLWLEMYEQHLETGNDIDYYLCHQ